MNTRHSISSIVSSRLMRLAVCALFVCASLTALAPTGLSQSGPTSPLFFYNAASGLGATALLDGAGNYQFVRAVPGFARGWTHVAGASNGALFFYNAFTGNGATARIDSAGNYQFVSAISGFAKDWTHIDGL